MSLDYDTDIGVLDLRDTLVVEIDEEGCLTNVIHGSIPETSSGEPYRFGIDCRDVAGNVVRLTTDMDFQTLVAD